MSVKVAIEISLVRQLCVSCVLQEVSVGAVSQLLMNLLPVALKNAEIRAISQGDFIEAVLAPGRGRRISTPGTASAGSDGRRRRRPPLPCTASTHQFTPARHCPLAAGSGSDGTGRHAGQPIKNNGAQFFNCTPRQPPNVIVAVVNRRRRLDC
jgi:hypothetical protein